MGRFRLAGGFMRGPGDQRMAIESKAARLRLLRERGRLGRSMRHGEVAYWIGHHRELGLLIFDPHAQREVDSGRVRLFSVADHESRLFMADLARTRSLWSSPDSHVEEMRKAVAEYGRARERQRETHCYGAGATSTPWTSPSAGAAAGSDAPAGTAAAATRASRPAVIRIATTDRSGPPRGREGSAAGNSRAARVPSSAALRTDVRCTFPWIAHRRSTLPTVDPLPEPASSCAR